MKRELTAAALQLCACLGFVVSLSAIWGWAGLVLALAVIAYLVGEDLAS